MYLLESLNNIVDKSFITDLKITKSKWNYKVPGGLGTNYPQRFVNTYGDGRYVTNKGNLKGSYWSSTYWTSR